MRVVGDAFAWTQGYTPSPKQHELHASTSPNLLYGGAAGGGKSRGFREDCRRFCLETPGAQVLFVRKTFSELRDNHWVPAMQEWRGDSPKFNQGDMTVTWGNGSRVIFGHCHNETDVYRYLGMEYDRAYIDELTMLPATVYDMVCSRLRTTKPNVKPRAIAGTNPGGIGHAWVKERWIDGTREGYAFIQATLSDNPIIDTPEYRARLAALPDLKRRAYLDGDWNQFEGQYFTEWLADVHVIDPFPLPAVWPRYLGVDYGSSAPFAAVWLCADPGTNPRDVYLYREYYQAGRLVGENAASVAALCGDEKFTRRVGDPSMWAKGPNELGSLADQARRAGLSLEPANNERLAGWQLLHELLRWSDSGRPRLRVFRGCVNVIRTLPTLVFDSRNVEDLDTDGDDHLADATRYAAMAAFGGGGVRAEHHQTTARDVVGGSQFGRAW